MNSSNWNKLWTGALISTMMPVEDHTNYNSLGLIVQFYEIHSPYNLFATWNEPKLTTI